MELCLSDAAYQKSDSERQIGHAKRRVLCAR